LSGFDVLQKYLTRGLYSSKEKGFLVYAIICKTISENYFFFQAVSSIIDIAVLYYFFKMYIEDRIALGFAFFCAFGGIPIAVNFLRNVKGILLFIISIKYLRERKLAPYMALNMLGFLFHVSSVIYLPLYFILHRKIPRKVILLLLIIGNGVYLLEIKWIKTYCSRQARYSIHGWGLSPGDTSRRSCFPQVTASGLGIWSVFCLSSWFLCFTTNWSKRIRRTSFF
jgi:hypothetical protein